jgi:hypothetical protein
MHVVAQQTITEKLNRLLLAVKGKLLQIPSSIVIVAKDRLAIVAAANHMIDGSWVFDPNRSRHGTKVSRLRPCHN